LAWNHTIAEVIATQASPGAPAVIKVDSKTATGDVLAGSIEPFEVLPIASDEAL
jgi:hypothetical protein